MPKAKKTRPIVTDKKGKKTETDNVSAVLTEPKVSK